MVLRQECGHQRSSYFCWSWRWPPFSKTSAKLVKLSFLRLHFKCARLTIKWFPTRKLSHLASHLKFWLSEKENFTDFSFIIVFVLNFFRQNPKSYAELSFPCLVGCKRTSARFYKINIALSFQNKIIWRLKAKHRNFGKNSFQVLSYLKLTFNGIWWVREYQIRKILRTSSKLSKLFCFPERFIRLEIPSWWNTTSFTAKTRQNVIISPFFSAM